MKPKHMRYSEWTGALNPGGAPVPETSDIAAESRYYLAQPGKSSNVFVALLGRRADGGSRPVPLDIPRRTRRGGMAVVRA